MLNHACFSRSFISSSLSVNELGDASGNFDDASAANGTLDDADDDILRLTVYVSLVVNMCIN